MIEFAWLIIYPSVARRVCAELTEPGPGIQGALCGYHVRMDSSQTADTRLLYCTTGILLRQLQGGGTRTGIILTVADIQPCSR